MQFEELGDLLFSAVNAARFISVDAEEALTRSSDKFLSRLRSGGTPCKRAEYQYGKVIYYEA